MNTIVLRHRPWAGARRGALVSRLALESLESRTVPAIAALAAVAPTSDDATHVLVRLRDGVAAGALGASAESLGGQLYRVGVADGQTVPEAVAAFAGRDDVLFAEPDAVVYAQAVPNDPRFGEQWGLHNVGQGGGAYDADIDAPAGWDVTTGRGQTIVAVIDSGVDTTHPDLAANIWRNAGEIAGNGADDDGNGFVDDMNGWNFLAGTNNVNDDYGHGTHVAGIIGAVGGNGLGVTGVAQNVKLMPLKFLNAGGSGLLSNAARAVNYAVANGADVINMSTGGVYDRSLQDAIAAARAAGVIVVAAAGNHARNTDVYPTYPAGYALDNIVTVGAVDSRNVLANFSNYGARSVDLAAPGVGILSTKPGGTYGVMNGTSMAAPFVAGAAALIRDLRPTWTYQQVINHILGTTSRLGGLVGKTVTGGVLNFGRALLNLPPATTPTPPPAPAPALTDTTGPRMTSATFGGSGGLGQVRVTFSEAINPASFTAADVAVSGPAGAVVVSSVAAVAGSNNTQFDVVFANQTAAGTYALAVGPDVRDAAGNAMDQNGNGVVGELSDAFRTETVQGPTSALTFTSTGVGTPINDLQTAVSTIVVDRDVSIGSVKVKLNVSHTFVADMVITLESPTGQRVTLFGRRGGRADNIAGTVFDDTAAKAIIQGTAPYVGSFRPETPLSALAGGNARGVWKLYVEDRAKRDSGTIDGWSLMFDGVEGGGANAAAVDGSGLASLTDPFAARKAGGRR